MDLENIPKTNPRSGRKINRAEDIDLTINNVTDTVDQFLTVSLEMIDTAIMYYFNEVIKPTVIENNSLVKVPVIYGSQERWKSIQQDGFIRDNAGKIMTPVIVFKRTNVAKDDQIPVDKLDANNPNLHYMVPRKYTQKNRFDQFSILTNQTSKTEYYNVIVPDYIVATFDVIMWTQYQSQMNSIVESMIYASDAYWGDVSKFRFRTTVSDIATPIEIATETDRTLKNTCSLTVKGYLVPNTINKILSDAGNIVKKSLSVKRVVLFTETDNIPTGILGPGSKPTSATYISTVPPTIISGGGGEGISMAITQLLQYLNKQYAKTATSVISDDGGGNTAAVWASQTIATPPEGYEYTQTAQENFIFFCNGQYIEHNAIVSFSSVGSDLKLIVNSTLLGYSFASDDEILAVGKFNS